MRKILVTGSEGYLMRELIERLAADDHVESIIGVDVRKEGKPAPKFTYHCLSVTDSALKDIVAEQRPDTIVHGAWVFNPAHDVTKQREIDIEGSRNVLKVAAESDAVEHVVYTGSTTAYGAIAENCDPDNNEKALLLKEEDWVNFAEKRLSGGYVYSADKAVVDQMFQEFEKNHPDKNTFWIRGSIVVGPGTSNIVSYVARSPFTLGLFMFQVKGYDPEMQFASEEDMINVLYRATMEKWKGVVNVAGEGTVTYTDLAKIMGKRVLAFPAFILYPLVDILWKMRILKFPSNLIDLIRYPWVGDITKLKEHHGYTPVHTSEEAIRQFADSR